MMQWLDIAGYVLAAVTVAILATTLGGPLVRQRVLVGRLRRDLKTIDSMVVAWARETGNR
jgi:hypothetical protein